MNRKLYGRLLRRAIAAAAVSAMCVTAAGAAYLGVGTVNSSSGLRLRSGPNGESSVIMSVPNREKVAVRARMDGGWYKVYYKGQLGYMSSDYVDLNTGVASADLGYGKVNAGAALNVRSGPGTGYDKVSKIKDGTVVKLIGMDSGWFKISWDGIEGYVSSDYITVCDDDVTSSAEPAKPAETTKPATDAKPAATAKPASTPAPALPPDADAAAQVVAYAKSFLGVPYVWGANGPNSFDCSGFTKYVYGHFGYSLGRTVSAQMKGTAVAKGEWQPGDLVFFSRNGSRPSHVGMYVGGGEFIHASTNGSNEVKISTLTSGYYDRVYIGAYRIL